MILLQVVAWSFRALSFLALLKLRKLKVSAVDSPFKVFARPLAKHIKSCWGPLACKQL